MLLTIEVPDNTEIVEDQIQRVTLGLTIPVVEIDVKLKKEQTAELIERLKLISEVETLNRKEIAALLTMPKIIARDMVTSSNVSSIGYDKFSKVLSVLFKGGTAEYRYLNVTNETAEGIIGSSSPGKAMHRLKTMYKCIKLMEN